MIDWITSQGQAVFGGAWTPLWILIRAVVIVVPLLLCVAYLILWERKLIGWMHVRIGPNRVGPLGLLQPIADVLKLLLKEVMTPSQVSKGLYLIAPLMVLMPAVAIWAVIPFQAEVVMADVNAGLLYVMAISSVGVYGVILAGWASNSKYAFIGAMRAAAQMVSYEIAMGFALVTVLMVSGSLNLSAIVNGQNTGYFANMGLNILSWNWLPLLPMFGVYFISGVQKPTATRSTCGRRIGNRGRPHDRVLGHGLRAVLPGRIHQHDHHLDDDRADVPRRLGAPGRQRRDQRDPGLLLAADQGVPAAVGVHLDPRFVPALPLRPDHAPGLEGLHSADRRMADHRGDLDQVALEHLALKSPPIPATKPAGTGQTGQRRTRRARWNY